MPELTGAETIGIMTTICVFFTNLMHLQFMRQLLPSRLNWYRISLVSAGIAAVTMPRYLWGMTLSTQLGGCPSSAFCYMQLF